MSKLIPDTGLDQLLDWVALGTKLVVCSTQPTTYTEANATYALADIVLDAADFTKADDTSGRKVTVGAQSAFLIDTSGTAQHIAIISTGDTTLRAVTTCTSQALVANGSNTVSTPAFKVSISDPT